MGGNMCLVHALVILLFLLPSLASKVVLLNAIDHEDMYMAHGGYAVLINDNITFQCNASNYSNDAILGWNIGLKTLSVNYVRRDNRWLADRLPKKFTAPNRLLATNPAEFRIHNLQLKENGSTILCGVPDYSMSGAYIDKSQAQYIFVESLPSCPTLKKSNSCTLSGCLVSWKPHFSVLPVNYTLSITSRNNMAVSSETTNQTRYEITKLMPSNVSYTVSVAVLACTPFGCSKNCDHEELLINRDVKQNPSTSNLAIIASAVITCIAIVMSILVIIVILSWCVIWRKKSGMKSQSTMSCISMKPDGNSVNNSKQEEYSTVADVVKNSQHTQPSITPSCSHHNNVITNTEGYGIVQNAAISPQKVRSETSFKQKPALPISSEYALVNHNTNSRTSTHVGPIAHCTRHSITGPIAVPSEYAQVPDSITMKPPLQRTQSIPTPSSIADSTFLPAPPPLPPRGSELSPESPDVIDAGYASLPHNNKSGKITKVRPSKRGSSGGNIQV